MSRILISGARGFIGRHCLAALAARGHEVHAITSSAERVTSRQAHWHSCDLLDGLRTKSLIAEIRPTHLLHLAWITAPGVYRDAPENVQWVESSLHLLRTFYQHGGRRAVFSGTCYEYDWSRGWCSEHATPLEPTTLYGTCKAALYSVAEQFAKSAQRSFAWARLFFLYGPHAPREKMPGAVIAAVLRGEEVRCTDAQQIRDFLYVVDAAEALTELLGSDLQGAVNVASGQPLRLRDLILAVTRQCGGEQLVRFGALPTPSHEPPLLLADTRRLCTELGWTPRYSFCEGLNETIKWWAEQCGTSPVAAGPAEFAATNCLSHDIQPKDMQA